MKTLILGCTGVIVLVLLVLSFGAVVGFSFWGRTSQVLTENLSEPLDGARAAKVDIDTSSGNLSIDRINGGEPVLANGTLEYSENQGVPARSRNSSNGQVVLTLRTNGTGSSSFRWPWEACNVATEWQIHVNPTVSSDITAHSGGGNVKLDLTGMTITRINADTGGGNLEVVAPEGAQKLDVTAKTGAGNVAVDIGSGTLGVGRVIATSGAGNVQVRVPSGLAAKVHVTGGLGKAAVDSRFSQLDNNTYQSPDYEGAANKIEITVSSGAGDVTISSK